MEKLTKRTLYHYPYEDRTIRVLHNDVFFFCADDILELAGKKLTTERIKRLHLDQAWYWDDCPMKMEIGKKRLLFLNELDILGVLVFDDGYLKQCVHQLLDDFRWPRRFDSRTDNEEDAICNMAGPNMSRSELYEFDTALPLAPNCFELSPVIKATPLLNMAEN